MIFLRLEAVTDIVSLLVQVHKHEVAVVISDFIDKRETQIQEWDREWKKKSRVGF